MPKPDRMRSEHCSRDVMSRVRRRAYAIAEGDYQRHVQAMSAALASGELHPDCIDQWEARASAEATAP